MDFSNDLSLSQVKVTVPITPGGYSRFQVTGTIEWGQKSKPKKIPGPKFNPKKSGAEFPSHKNF